MGAERQGRPLPGNSPHEPAGKPEISFHRCRRVCDDPLPATWLKTRSCVVEAMRNLSVRCGFHLGPGHGLPLVGRGPGKGTRREEHVLLIGSDAFRPATPRSGYSPAWPASASPAGRDYHALFNHPGQGDTSTLPWQSAPAAGQPTVTSMKFFPLYRPAPRRIGTAQNWSLRPVRKVQVTGAMLRSFSFLLLALGCTSATSAENSAFSPGALAGRYALRLLGANGQEMGNRGGPTLFF